MPHPNSKLPLADRFLFYIQKTEGCWQWMGHRNKQGYGAFHGTASILAHRTAYELFKGPIPADLDIDHLCRNRACVNPDHLEAVDHRVNVLRGVGLAAKEAKQTHCVHGHPFSGDNLRMRSNGRGRVCVACQRDRNRRFYERKVALKAGSA